ncbi:hypothetical protein D9M73_136510 [compost metagenome]
MQCVLGAAMDDALGLHTLPAAEAGAFHQHGRKTLATQARIQPEAGDTSADNQHVGGNNGWHSATSVFKTRAQYTDSKIGGADASTLESTSNPVAASLLAIAVGQSTLMLNAMPSSRASSLPQGGACFEL